MDISHITSTFVPCLSAGGVVNASYQIAKIQNEENRNVKIFTTDSCKKRLKFENRYGVDVDGMKVYYFRNLSNQLKSSFLIDTPVSATINMNKMKNSDILHIHEHRHSLAILSSHYAFKNNIPYVLQAHGSVLPFFQKEKLKKFFDKLWGFKIINNASKLFALTEVEKDQYIKMGVSEEKIEIVPLGINLNEFSNLPEKGKFRLEYGINDNDKLILFLGRIHKIKGIDLLLKSFKILNDEIADDMNVKLAIVGPDDGFLTEVNEIIEKLKLKDKVILTGPLFNDDKKIAINDSDVFVMPSQYESFTTSGLEAMACKKPLVVTKNNHIHTWVDNNVGFSCDYNEKDLANSIKKILIDEKIAKKFGKKGRELIEKKYNWELIEKQINTIYSSIINDS